MPKVAGAQHWSRTQHKQHDAFHCEWQVVGDVPNAPNVPANVCRVIYKCYFFRCCDTSYLTPIRIHHAKDRLTLQPQARYSVAGNTKPSPNSTNINIQNHLQYINHLPNHHLAEPPSTYQPPSPPPQHSTMTTSWHRCKAQSSHHPAKTPAKAAPPHAFSCISQGGPAPCALPQLPDVGPTIEIAAFQQDVFSIQKPLCCHRLKRNVCQSCPFAPHVTHGTIGVPTP